MHRDGDGESAAGDEVVDHGGDGIDGDFAVEALAGLGVDGVGHEVLGAEAFLDVGEEVVGGLDEVGAFAAGGGGFGVAVGGEGVGRGAGGFLAGALEGIELIVTDAGGFVGERHGKMMRSV